MKEAKEWINKSIGGHYQITYFYLDHTNAFFHYLQMCNILQILWPRDGGKENMIWRLSLFRLNAVKALISVMLLKIVGASSKVN